MQLREAVKARLSRRNWIALISTLCAAPIPVIAASSGQNFHGWTVLVFLLSGGAAMLVWHLNPWRARVRCPVCGEDWEHDEFLGWSQCEKCGLRLPASET